jgi:hypothetical protein
MKARATLLGSLLALVMPWTLAGCAGIDVLGESAQCPGGTSRQVTVIQDQASLERAWRSMANSPMATPAPMLGARRGLFLTDVEYPTAGHGLTLGSRVLTTQLGVASLRVRTATPEGMVAQVVTRPCLLLALPGGDYQRVEVLDQSGMPWGAADLAK